MRHEFGMSAHQVFTGMPCPTGETPAWEVDLLLGETARRERERRQAEARRSRGLVN